MPRVCSQSSQPDDSASQMNERQEGCCEFVVARGDASELLDATEETLDQIAALVDMPVERAGVESVRARWNDRLAALRRNRFDEGIRIVALVGDDELGRLILNQRCRLLDVGDLPGRENDPQWIAQGIDGHVQFGGQSAPRAADFLLAGFFGAPAECWWARTMVESMNRCSMSASPCSAVATRSQTPFSRQRAKRT